MNQQDKQACEWKTAEADGSVHKVHAPVCSAPAPDLAGTEGKDTQPRFSQNDSSTRGPAALVVGQCSSVSTHMFSAIGWAVPRESGVSVPHQDGRESCVPPLAGRGGKGGHPNHHSRTCPPTGDSCCTEQWEPKAYYAANHTLMPLKNIPDLSMVLARELF